MVDGAGKNKATKAGKKQEADRVGLGWRPELADDILDHLGEIDVVEVLADPWFGATRQALSTLTSVAARVPVLLRGAGLGLASAAPVPQGPLEEMARLVDVVRPDAWSEHLAFVRAGTQEIGHLAAPPRHLATIHGTLANLERARRVVGSFPRVENVATLIDPPGSVIGEGAWLTAVLTRTPAPFLLDLHSLYANAVSFGRDPFSQLRTLPLDKVRGVHLSGGRWVGPPGSLRLLDDHRHDPPEVIYQLLTLLGRLAPQPLDVIIERDGKFPDFLRLRQQVLRARQALEVGRAQGVADGITAAPGLTMPPLEPVPEPLLRAGRALEAALAQLYSQGSARAALFDDPSAWVNALTDPDLGDGEREALREIDQLGLELFSVNALPRREDRHSRDGREPGRSKVLSSAVAKGLSGRFGRWLGQTR